MTTVVDISHYQPTIDWQALAKAVGAVMLKVSDGLSIDPTFKAKQAGARAVGLPLMYYHFGRTGGPAKDQAAYFVRTAQAAPGERLVLDLEVAVDDQWALDFLEEVYALGATLPALYTSASLARSFPKVCNNGYPLWVAAYGANNGQPNRQPSVYPWTWPPMAWQYTSNGTVSGIPSRVDLSEFYAPIPSTPGDPDMLDSPTLTNAQFVADAYRRILGQEPDAAGLDFWTGKLDRSEMTRNDVRAEFLAVRLARPAPAPLVVDQAVIVAAVRQVVKELLGSLGA